MPFGQESTADEVVQGLDLHGKRAIVTGASSGIGAETARALASAGADVTLAVRDTAVGHGVAAEIAAATGATVRVGRIELTDLRSVAEFVSAWDGPLHILVNNAGVMALPHLEFTPAGWERQFGANHLGHFALAVGLHRHLAAAGRARIVSLTSNAHLLSPVVFDDINYSRRPYDRWTAYGQSKTATCLFAVGATRVWAHDGITADAVHPGAVPGTNLSRHMKRARRPAIGTASTRWFFKSVEQGAATTVLVATSPHLAGCGGRYFEDCRQAEPAVLVAGEPAPTSGVAPHALDPDAAAQLWDLSTRAIAPA